MSLVIKINTVDRSSDIEQETVRLDMTLTKEPATLAFIIKGLKTMPDLGDTVLLTEDAGNFFKGSITEKLVHVTGSKLLAYEFTATDGTHELDRLLVVKAYNDTDAVAVVTDIVTNFATGFTIDALATSPTVKSIRFQYEQPSRCIQKIADEVGWDWYIDADDVVHFFPPDTVEAPFTITDDNGNCIFNTLEFDRNILELRNVVYVRGGEYLDPVSEGDAIDKYESNGEDNTFPLVYRYSNVEVTRNGTAQTVGVDFIDALVGDALSTGTTTSTTADKLVDTAADFVTDGVAIGDQIYNSTTEKYASVTAIDSATQLSVNHDIFTSGDGYTVSDVLKQCLYNYQEKLVRFPDGTLDSGDIVRVFGDANIPLIVQASDPDSVLEYGTYEGIEIDKNITSIEEAEAFAWSLIEKWRDGSKEGSFKTTQKGLRVGQTITINSTTFGINEDYKINKISGYINGHDSFEYQVDFIKSGQVTLNDILVGLIGRDRENVEIAENEVVQIFRQIEDAFSMSDEIVSVTSDSPPYHYGPVSAGNEGKYNFCTYT